jgi:quercetin dioxygenase-like cupin family protein
MSDFRFVEPAVVGSGGATRLDVFGEIVMLLVSGKETNGAFSVLTERSPPGGGTPLHTHRNEDEALYVLEGEYDIRRGAETVRAGPGSFVFAARGVPHGFTNVSSSSGTILAVVSPAGFEGFFEEVSALRAPAAVEKIMGIAAKYGLEIHAP